MNALSSHFIIEELGGYATSAVQASPPVAYSVRHSELSSLSVASDVTTNSTNTVDPRSDPRKVALDKLCDLVNTDKSLRTARIVSCATYVRRGLFVTHRFVVMKLRRNDRKDTYIRIDRRPASRSRLIRGIGTTISNDEVYLSTADPSQNYDGTLTANLRLF